MKSEKISIGQNLKIIRKDLNLRQQDIAGNEVTRNLISLIENDKTPIYHNVANIISNNINRILDKKNVEIYIEPDDILNPERYLSRTKANYYIEELENKLKLKDYNIQDKLLNEIESFLNEWNFIDKKIKIYHLLGDIYHYAGNFEKEYHYLLKALEVSYEIPNMKNRFRIALKLIANYIMLKKYREAIRLSNFTLSTEEITHKRYKGVFYYNNAFAYYHLKDYDNCFRELENAKPYFTYDSKDMKKVYNLEGISHDKVGNYDDALASYNKLLEIIGDDPTELCFAYSNMIQVFISMKDKEKVNEYYNKIQDCIPYADPDSYEICSTLFSLGPVYYFFKDYKNCEEVIKKSIVLSKKHNDPILVTKNILNIIKLYTETGQIEKIDELVSIYKDELSNLSTDENLRIILEIIYTYINQGYELKAKTLIENLLKKEVY